VLSEPEHLYSDEAASGVSVEGRSGLQRLVQAALRKPRPFDLILIDDTSRLSRNVVDSVQHFRELRFHGVDLYFVNQGLHSSRDNAEFLLSIYGAMDSEYIRELGRKTRRGLEGQVLKGFSAGDIAYGYRREPVFDPSLRDREGLPRRNGVRWALEPKEAETVTLIYQWYADGVGMDGIAARLNARGVPCPRQSKGHRPRRDGVGPGWDLSAVRVILINELYQGRRIWNRSHWVREPGSRRRRRVLNPENEWIVVEQPELRIVNDVLWQRVQARRAQLSALYSKPSQFGKTRAAYGTYLLSGLLVCGYCDGSQTIRTGSPDRNNQKYGCTRHWRRGSAACANNVLLRRDVAEAKVFDLLRERLYTPEAILRLVEMVNSRLKALAPTTAAERESLEASLGQLRHEFEGYRKFVAKGDTSIKVRQWLTEAEQKEARLREQLARLDEREARRPLQVHPSRVERYLSDLGETLRKGGQRARQLLHEDIARIVIHPVRSDTVKHFARAEVVTTGKGLLERVAFVVAGVGFEPTTFGL